MTSLPARLVRRRRFSQMDFDAFAALSGDDNPIHVDAAYAARTRFGRPVAHGMLLLSVIRGMAEEMAPGMRLARHEIRFPAPARVEEPLAFTLARDGDEIAFQGVSEEAKEVICDGRLVLESTA